MVQAGPAQIDAITVPLRSRRRARALVVQKIQHVIPASGLFFAGTQALREGAHGGELALAIVEIVTSAGLVVNFVRHARATRRSHAAPSHEHHGVDWFEFFSAGVLFTEAYEQWHLKHHIARPTILLASVTLAMAFLHGRIAGISGRRRVLHVDERGVRVGGRPLRTFFAPWRDISAITVSGASAEIRTRSGSSRRIDLGDLHNAEQVRGALLAARQHLQQLTPAPAVDIRPKLS